MHVTAHAIWGSKFFSTLNEITTIQYNMDRKSWEILRVLVTVAYLFVCLLSEFLQVKPSSCSLDKEIKITPNIRIEK